ncbi:MAG TPA: hypothetical protein VMV77_07480 [Bacteroidales bacterium]|nr:hypothetical protein [Bacteroidales bacterium]
MITGNDKYDKVLEILRKSKPCLYSEEEFEKEVIKRISRDQRSGINFPDLIDLLFGWVYIGWVRRSLIAASIVLIMVFVYQQGVLLKQMNYLSRQIIVTEGEVSFNPAVELEKKIMMYKFSGRRFSSQNITFSEKELKQLLESFNELQFKYEDLINMIEEDPDLKKYIEKKLIENSSTKINL